MPIMIVLGRVFYWNMRNDVHFEISIKPLFTQNWAKNGFYTEGSLFEH
jgi:hypothetical protein